VKQWDTQMKWAQCYNALGPVNWSSVSQPVGRDPPDGTGRRVLAAGERHKHCPML
jgi:hypothetical protein